MPPYRRMRESLGVPPTVTSGGAGFAIFEAQYAHNFIFAYGWTWEWVQAYGFVALLGF
jgi:hypothetical protein